MQFPGWINGSVRSYVNVKVSAIRKLKSVRGAASTDSPQIIRVSNGFAPTATINVIASAAQCCPSVGPVIVAVRIINTPSTASLIVTIISIHRD